MNEHILFSWDAYYGSLSIEEQYDNKEFTSKNQVLNLTEGNTYIHNSFFHNMHSSAHGGAIVYSKQGSNFLVEKCLFHNCSSNFTSAIIVSAGNFVLSLTCGEHCFSSGNDGFSSVHTDEKRERNTVFGSSISYCQANERYIIYHEKGPIDIKSLNISHNIAQIASSIGCLPDKFFDEIKLGTMISYSNINNNTATKEQCLVMNNQNNEECGHKIDMTNIISNQANRTIYSKGETNMFYCSILNNRSPCFYSTNQNLKIILTMCYSDEKDSVSITKEQDQFILSLPFFFTGLCDNNIYHCHCTENSFLQNLYIHKIIIPSPFIFLILSNRK